MDNRTLETLRNPNIEFVVVANSKLKELIVQNEHPYIKDIPQSHKLAFLQSGDGAGVAMDRELIIKYVEGTLDVRQKFILDNCEVRAIGNWNALLKSKV